MRRLLALLASLSLLGVLAPVSAASADPIASCTASTGTIVAVDFRHWGGPVVRGCGVDSSTGYRLLHDGGFTTAGDAHDGPAFICRIGNAAYGGGTQYPTVAQDACQQTPPASAYWSYWLAPKGQNTWSYSQLGAMSEKPKQGEVELWQFGGTNVAGSSGRPTISPAALRATNARPGSGSGGSPAGGGATHAGPASSAAGNHGHGSSGAQAPRTANATTGAVRPTGSSGSTARTSASASAGPVTGRATAPKATAGLSGGTPGTAPASTAPSIVDASAVAQPSSTAGGSPWPVILGVALVLLLGAGGGWGVLRRRRADAAEH